MLETHAIYLFKDRLLVLAFRFLAAFIRDTLLVTLDGISEYFVDENISSLMIRYQAEAFVR